MKIHIRALLLVGCAAASAAAAEKQPVLPKDLPAYGTTRPVKAPPVKELKLENGLTIWLVPEPGFPKVAFTVAVRGGYTADPKDRPGFADLLAATVTQGTSTQSARQLAEGIAAAGGDFSTDATADAIFIETSVLASKNGAAIKILADVMRNAALAGDEVEIAKNNLISTVEASEADPAFLGRRALYRTLFGEHPYAITAPDKEAIAKTSAADLKREYARRFRPDRTILVAAGDFEEASLMTDIRAGFGEWRSSGEAAPIESEKPKASFSRAVVYVPRPNSVQTAFYIGALGPDRADPDYAAARVANAIYGGMFGSRLVTNIREDKGYTYSPGARLIPIRETGVLMTSADVRNPVTGASFNEISYELNRMATTAPDEQEVDHAKRFLLGSLALQLQARQRVAHSLASLWIDSLPPEELGRQSEKIDSLKPADVEAAGRKYFPAWRMSVVTVGEEKVIRDELGPFGVEFRKAQ